MSNEKNTSEYTFTLSAYYDEALRGLEDRENGLSFEKAQDTLHEWISKGGYIKVECEQTGREKVFEYDEYFKDFEGESPLMFSDFEELEEDREL